MKKILLMIAIIVCFSNVSKAESVVVGREKNKSLSLSIHNNMSLVRDVRNINLPSGKNTILFEDVSEQMKSESVMVNAKGVTVIEQNYNFELLSPENMAKANVGKIVKTVMWDPEKLRNVFGKARILEVYAGKPILQFEHGIEFDYPGRIIWDNIPENLRTKPSLNIGVNVLESGDKVFDLMYLTAGLRWTTNYVAEFVNDTELNLKAWVGIQNITGLDYKNAQVQLVAGDANIVQDVMRSRPMMLMNTSETMIDNASYNSVMSPSEESVGEYHVYSLPEKITIANNQTKQVSLLAKDKIKYVKEYRAISPIYLAVRTDARDFKKLNTDVYIKINNKEEDNLGVPLPKGLMRFYEHDSKGNIVFAGENNFKSLAVGDTAELKIGNSFDVTVSGKVINQNKVSSTTIEKEVNITFMNAKTTSVNVVFNQFIKDDWEIISSNVEGVKIDANNMQWAVNVPAQGSAILNFKVRMSKIEK